MKSTHLLLIVFLSLFLTGVDLKAQELADKISYATVIANITLDTIHSFKAEDKKDALKDQAIRTAIAIGLSEVLKRVVHETRPDLSDDKSWPSEHSALSCVSVNVTEWKRFKLEFPIALGTMVGRVQADKHFWWDVLSGCGIGIASGFIVSR